VRRQVDRTGHEPPGIEPGIQIEGRDQAAREETGAGQQYQRDSHLCGDEEGARPAARGLHRAARPRAQRVVDARRESEYPGHQRNEQRDSGRGSGCREEDGNIRSKIEQLDVDASGQLERAQSMKQRPGHGNGGRGADERQQRTLDRDAQGQPAAAGAKRKTHRELVLSSLRADQQQHADRQPGNQQEQSDGHREEPRELRHARPRALGNRRGAERRQDESVFASHGGWERVQVRERGVRRDAGFQASDDAHRRGEGALAPIAGQVDTFQRQKQIGRRGQTQAAKSR
jgi:hypothetical protein